MYIEEIRQNMNQLIMYTHLLCRYPDILHRKVNTRTHENDINTMSIIK